VGDKENVICSLSSKFRGLPNVPPGTSGVSLIGTPKIYTTTGFGLKKNRKMAGVQDLVVYIQTAVFHSSLHIHDQIVHTSHSPIFSRPKPGGGVYLWGPNLMPCSLQFLVACLTDMDPNSRAPSGRAGVTCRTCSLQKGVVYTHRRKDY